MVGAAKGALVGSGEGVLGVFATDFAAGFLGSALEQEISRGRVDIGESLLSGAGNALSEVLYGTGELKGVKDAFLRGARTGAVMSGVENITDHVGSYGVAGSRLFGKTPNEAIIPEVTKTGRDPKGMCGANDPFDLSGGLGNGRGYHSGRAYGGAGHSRTGESGFSLGGFVRDVLTGAVVGGLGSAGFYGAGKAVEVLRGSVVGRGVRRGSGETPVSRRPDFYVAPNGDVIPATGYRYSARNVLLIQNAKKGYMVARSDGMYFSFDKIDDAIIAQGKLQIPYRPEYRISFDTLDILDDLHIPKGNWGRANYLEPITKDFKIFGPGGATQAVTYSKIKSIIDISKLR